MTFSTTDYPYSTIVSIFDTFSDGQSFHGSGVLIAPNEVLTAAHVVWRSDIQAPASKVTVIPGENGSTEPFGQAVASYEHYYQVIDSGDTISLDQSQFDFALIHLADPIGNSTGTMGYESNFSGGAVHITGYPANLGSETQLDRTLTISADPNYTIYDLAAGTTSPGDSGGPVWIMQNGQPYVVGINSSTSASGEISTAVFNQLQAWIAADDGTPSAPPPPAAPPPASPPPGSVPFDAGWQIVGVGDFSGDGKADLAYQRTSDGIVEIQLLDGTSPSGGGVIRNTPFGADWFVAGRGDFNGDGKSDLVYRRTSDGLAEIQLLNGTTAIGGGVISNNPFDSGWSIVATGDFNGDGDADLTWRRNSDGLVELQFLNGTSARGGGIIANNPFGSDWSIVARGDFNGDGRTDLVWRRASDGVTEIQLLNGTSSLGGGLIAKNPFGTDWTVVGAGDFNGDGKADLVWQRQSDGVVEIQYLNGNTAIGGGLIQNNPLGSGWNVAGVADFNGDGRSDLVYRRSDGATEIELLNGLTLLGNGLTASPDAGLLPQPNTTELLSAGVLVQPA